MAVWVALLRGINLGSRNQVNMPRLRAQLSASDFTDVRTYVQSGNVVVSSGHSDPEQVADAVRAVLRSGFDLDVPVVVRTPDQLRDVLAWNPLPDDAATRPTQVHVIHLAAEPDLDRVKELCSEDWAPDGLAVRGPEVVIRYAETMRTSRLQHTKVLKRLGVDGTARNWRTLTALVELAERVASPSR